MFLVFLLLFSTLFSFCFWPIILFIFVHFPRVCSTDKHNTTQHTHIQHTTYTMHNHTQHTIPTIHSTSHNITSQHITFCTCLVLILVVMPYVSGQAVVVGMSDFSMKAKRAHCSVCSVLFSFVSWSRISVGLRGFPLCGGECLDPKDREQCLTRTNFRGGLQRY